MQTLVIWSKKGLYADAEHMMEISWGFMIMFI